MSKCVERNDVDLLSGIRSVARSFDFSPRREGIQGGWGCLSLQPTKPLV